MLSRLVTLGKAEFGECAGPLVDPLVKFIEYGFVPCALEP